jgi:2,5-dihydroxypyridine 5,6-dioxygenase
MSDSWELIKLFGDVLDLCKVHGGETFAVLTEGGERSAHADAWLIAAQERGATSFQVNVPKRVPITDSRTKQTALSGNTGAMSALKTADMIVDLIGLLWSAEQQQLQAAGARILMCRNPLENMIRMFPTAELRRRVEAAAAVLGNAREMHVTSPGGTDVLYKLGQYPVITQYGYTDEPGRWDNCPGGFLYSGGNDGCVDGTVVIDAGDIILPFKRYLDNPIRLTIDRGVVTDIEGKHTDGRILRDYMARYNDPRAYAVSHVGWGMDEKATWDYLATSPIAGESVGVDARAFYGNVLFSTGPNSELGGTNDTACHLDIPLRGCSLTLDGTPILDAGTIVPRELAAAGR